ncbi:unnamed protein product [Lupinus luteus]|uniref:MHD2 domain-containing protein n=1 Tax=Lupinus luteus TaxID=3873 RepID=A0AAV1YK63_LUPLU
MGLHSRRRRRHESSPGNFPPLPPPPSISIPLSPLHHHRTRHQSSSGPLPPLSPPPIPDTNHHEPNSPPTSPPPPPLSSRSRRDSYPGPFPSFLSPSSSDPPIFHTRNETCPGPFFDTHHHREESDPSTSYVDHYNCTNKRTLELYYHEQEHNLAWPFHKLNVHGLDHDDIRETAYEIFFTACRSSPGFGGRNAITFYSKHESNNGNEGKGSSVPVSHTSRVKRALGLKMIKSLSQKIMVPSGGGGGGWSSAPCSPLSRGVTSPGKSPRQMSMADVMRVQMLVSEQSDSRLRKTLMRTLVGQLGRQAETIILPLELLRHLKPSEFKDLHEYHLWQKRQLKILEAGILLHPSIPVEKTNTFAINISDAIRSAEAKPLDTGKNSDTMRTFSNSVVSLAMRSPNGAPTNICHWANGYPVNVHLYMSLLQSIFDLKDETSVLDEVDELLDLMKKTWSTLGINRPIHNVCFTWLLFQQYVVTGQIEPDLLCASHSMLNEVANDAKKEKQSSYVTMLTSVLSSLQGWADKRLLAYHDYFRGGDIKQIENLLPLVLAASKILGSVTNSDGGSQEKRDKTILDSSGDRVEDYIRSSMKIAFEKVGLKENYAPSLPPLTRCYRDSKLQKLLKIASPCSVSCEEPHILGIEVDNNPHSCTSRGTQRLYIRLNTLHYLLSCISSLDKSLTLNPGAVPSMRRRLTNNQRAKGNNNGTLYFESANCSILAACKHVSEVASYRLIFLDSNFYFYDGLYVGDVANSRINHALKILKHSIKLMTAILTERAHALAVNEVMKASFDAFLMVLIAGGTSRAFNESDHHIIQEDFENLKHIFMEGLIAENVVEKEGQVVEGVISLMGMSTEQLMENLSIVTNETNGVGIIGNGHKLPMPPTTGKWNRTDPNTILRVLCYRNDKATNHFLKRTFHIPKR